MIDIDHDQYGWSWTCTCGASSNDLYPLSPFASWPTVEMTALTHRKNRHGSVGFINGYEKRLQ